MIAQRQTRATSTLPRAGARSRIQENNSAQTLVALFVLALLLPSYFFLGDLLGRGATAAVKRRSGGFAA